VEVADAAAAIEVAVAWYEPLIPELSGTLDDPLVNRDGAVPVKLLGGALPENVDEAAMRPVAFGADDSWPETPVEVPGEVPLVSPPDAAPLAFVKEADAEAEADDSPAEATEVVPVPEPVMPPEDEIGGARTGVDACDRPACYHRVGLGVRNRLTRSR
jgi:hypothetical protein